MTRIIAALAVAAVLAGALAGCETPKDRDARICAIAADPVAIANQAGATWLGAPVPEGNDSPPDRVVVIPGKLAIIDTSSPATVASRVGGQVITPQQPPPYTPAMVTPPP